MKRKHKKYDKPRKLYDKARIEDENRLLLKYGLKNKKEIWKTESKIRYYRGRAKALITADPETQKKFFDKLNLIGLNVFSISDVLALQKEDLLKRRLSSVVVVKRLANTASQARQMIVHKRVIVNGSIINIPSYLVKIDEEGDIKIREAKVKAKPKEDTTEVKGEINGVQNE